jgi:hypothetical protein
MQMIRWLTGVIKHIAAGCVPLLKKMVVPDTKVIAMHRVKAQGVISGHVVRWHTEAAVHGQDLVKMDLIWQRV